MIQMLLHPISTAPARTARLASAARLSLHDRLARSTGLALMVGSVLSIAAALSPSAAAGQSPGDYDTQIRQLMNHPAVRAAMEHIEETDDQTMADLRELTQIPAPPFMEEERGQAFLEKLLEIGVDSAWVDEVGNVIGLRRGTGDGEVLALAGHLDTVFPPETDVTIRESGDTLFAPGIADDTRGLATILAVLRAMNETNVRTDGDVLFIGNVGEEGLGDLRGVKHLFREGGPRIDTFISVDGTSSAGITHMGLGSHRYRVTFIGPGGHSWGAFGLANPAHAMGRAIRYFQDGADPYVRNAPFRTSYNVGRIGGGTSINSVPFESWAPSRGRGERHPDPGRAADGGRGHDRRSAVRGGRGGSPLRPAGRRRDAGPGHGAHLRTVVHRLQHSHLHGYPGHHHRWGRSGLRRPFPGRVVPQRERTHRRAAGASGGAFPGRRDPGELSQANGQRGAWIDERRCTHSGHWASAESVPPVTPIRGC